MRLQEIAAEYHEPLIRVVGRNFPDTFLHGTAKKNIRSLAAASRPDTSKKKTTGNLIDYLVPPEQNEFHAEMFLSDPRQPQQAFMFSQGRGNALAIVRLKVGTKVLDLSDEVTRAPHFSFGGHEILRFFSRPAITDDLIRWQLGRIVQGYRDRHPDWQTKYTNWMDPASTEFRVNTWQDSLVPYCKAHGIGAVRFADEILITDRNVIRDARAAKEPEINAAATTRTWPGGKSASLFTDQKTGAHDEADSHDDDLKENVDQIRKLLVIVHPGSACGSASMNLGSAAEGARDFLTHDIAKWHDGVIVIDGDLSDELPRYPRLDGAIKAALNQARSKDLIAVRLYGDDNSTPTQTGVARKFIKQMKLNPAEWNVELTGAWIESGNMRSGCVTSVYDVFRRMGFNASIRDSALDLDQS